MKAFFRVHDNDAYCNKAISMDAIMPAEAYESIIESGIVEDEPDVDGDTLSVTLFYVWPTFFFKDDTMEFDDIDSADCDVTIDWVLCSGLCDPSDAEVRVIETIPLKKLAGLQPITLEDIGYSEELMLELASRYMRNNNINFPVLGAKDIWCDGVRDGFVNKVMPIARISM